VPDEGHREACLRVKLRLKGKKREQPVDRAGHGIDALAPPRPHRRAHIVDRADASPLQSRLEAEVEVRRVHADEQPHTFAPQPAVESTANSEELGHARENLDVTAQ